MKLKKQNGLYVPNRNLENIVVPRRTFLRGAIAGAGSLALAYLGCSDKNGNGKKTGTGTSGTGTDTDTGTSNTNTNTSTAPPTFNYQIFVGNIYIKNFTPIQGVKITLNSLEALTNADGIAEFQLENQGQQDISYEKSGFKTFNSQINIQKDLPSTLEYIVPFSTENEQILDEHYQDMFLWYNGQLQKPNFETQIIYIDTTNAPNQAAIDQIVNILENEFPDLTDNKFTATRANERIIIDTNPPPYGTNNYFIFLWSDSGGGHYEWFNDPNPNLITSSYARVGTDANIGVYREEAIQGFLGLRSDSSVPQLQLITLFESGESNGVTDNCTEDRKTILRSSRRLIGSEAA